MELTNLEIAKQHYKQCNFSTAKQHYDLYIEEFNSNLELDNLNSDSLYRILEINNDYIESIHKIYNYDMSENNTVFNRFYETIELVQTKIKKLREIISTSSASIFHDFDETEIQNNQTQIEALDKLCTKANSVKDKLNWAINFKRSFLFTPNKHLDIASQNYQQSNFSTAKQYYDLYIEELNSNLDLPNLEWDELNQMRAIGDEYVSVIFKIFNLNVSESNSLYKRFDERKQAINNQIRKFGRENEREWEFIDPLYKLSIGVPDEYISYKERTEAIISIAKSNPKFILDSIISIDDFAVQNSLFLINSIQKEKEFLAAIEVNSIKQLIVQKWGEFYHSETVGHQDPIHYDDNPSEKDYDAFKDAFDGDIDAWNHHNQ